MSASSNAVSVAGFHSKRDVIAAGRPPTPGGPIIRRDTTRLDTIRTHVCIGGWLLTAHEVFCSLTIFIFPLAGCSKITSSPSKLDVAASLVNDDPTMEQTVLDYM